MGKVLEKIGKVSSVLTKYIGVIIILSSLDVWRSIP